MQKTCKISLLSNKPFFIIIKLSSYISWAIWIRIMITDKAYEIMRFIS